MSLRFRFLEYVTNTLLLDTPAMDATLSIGVNKSSEWSGTFPANISRILTLRPSDLVEIYFEGELLLEGAIEEIKQSYDLSQKVEIKGKDALDRLYTEKADSNLSVINQSVLLILSNLLRRAGWELGDVSTFVPASTVITLDMRSEKQLMAQIQAVINSVGKFNYRQGKPVNGTRTLDVGIFGEPSEIRFVTPPYGLDQALASSNLVQSFSGETSNAPLMALIEPRGGDIKDNTGVQRTVLLRTFVEATPAALTYPDFPVIEDRYRERYSVVNTAWGNFGGVVEGPPQTGVNLVWLGLSASSAINSIVFSTYAYGGKLGYLDFWQSPNTGAGTAYTGIIEMVVKEAAAVLTTTKDINPNPVLFTKQFPTTGLLVNGVAPRRIRFDLSDSNLTLEWGKRYSFFMEAIPPQIGVAGSKIIDFYAGDVSAAPRYSSAIAVQGTGSTFLVPFRLTTFSELPENTRVNKTVETWTQYTPPQKETNSTLPEILGASTALYNRTVQVLKERQGEPTQFKLSAAGRKLITRLGSLVYINTYSESSRLNVSTQTPEVFRNRIEGNFYVLDYSLKFGNNNVTADYTLLDEVSFRSSGNVVDMYDSAKTARQPVGNVIPDLDTTTLYQFQTIITGVPANATLNGHPARLVEVVVYGFLPGHTSYQLLGQPVIFGANGPYREIEMVSYGSGVLGTTCSFLVSVNRTWDSASTMTVTLALAAR